MSNSPRSGRWQGKPPEEVVTILEQRLADAHQETERLKLRLLAATPHDHSPHQMVHDGCPRCVMEVEFRG